ncbi:MAG: transcriptional repressor LexA [Clostridia bacterium]|nr:transcriptional repressor LexA [Clostridia bacterium]
MAGKRRIDEMAVYEYIRKCSGGVPPTVREIADACGIKSTSGVHSCLCLLEERGLIERDPKNSRSIRLPGIEIEPVPVVGRVAAGVPILSEQCIDGYIPISKSFARNRTLFALKVRGDSMINAGILPDDTLVCEQTERVENGQIGVALIDDEATVKRIYFEDDHIRLQPENDAYEPIITRDAQILGRVVSCIREYK